MTFPFDPKVFSDNELFEKQFDLIKRRYIALRVGKVDMANQIDVFIQLIELERRERMFGERIAPLIDDGDPVMVETEPDLQVKREAEAPAPSASAAPSSTGRRRYVRTSHPVTPKVEQPLHDRN